MHSWVSREGGISVSYTVQESPVRLIKTQTAGPTSPVLVGRTWGVKEFAFLTSSAAMVMLGPGDYTVRHLEVNLELRWT